MTEREDIQHKIESLEFSKQLLEKEIESLKSSLDRINLEQEEAWKANEYVRSRITKKLAEYFRSVGYAIVECQTKTPDNPCYAIAKQVWGCKEVSIPFFKELSKSASTSLSYPIDGLPAERKCSLRNLCKTMAENKWITSEISKEPLEVKFPKRLKTFFNGGWAEEVNRYLINKVLSDYASSHKLKYKVFWNIKLKKFDSERNNNDMQLDIAVQLNNRFYIFETKTGVLGIEKWVKRAELFNRNGNRFLTCCMDSEVNPKLFQPYKLLSLEKLEVQLVKLLDGDFPSES